METDKPKNYDKSLDGFTPDWKGKMNNPDPSLSTVKDFGSAGRDVLKTSDKVRGGAPQRKEMGGVTGSHKIFNKGSDHAVQGQGSGRSPNLGAFSKQIASKVESGSVKEKSASKIFHGNPSQKKL